MKTNHFILFLIFALLLSACTFSTGNKERIVGSGDIRCGDPKAGSASVKLDGTGNITVYASQSLDTNIRGSGNVLYRGNPAKVNKSVPGAGNISPLP
jgi:hypothetical protein